MWLAFGVALLAGAGAVSRYIADRAITHWRGSDFPWGTLVINVAGSFVLGVVVGLATHHGLSQVAAVVIGSGFCAGFTTFSTWTWETLALTEEGALLQASLNALGSLAAGLGAAALGLWITL
jgi:CrcB protein